MNTVLERNWLSAKSQHLAVYVLMCLLYKWMANDKALLSRRMRWAGYVARMGEKRNAYSILVGKPEGKRPLGRPRRRWMDNIKMDHREIEWDGMD
jgi:hypothetical protein